MQKLTMSDKPTISTYDRMHFGIIRFVHETLYGIFVNSFEKLKAARLERGQEVLEVGPGPGYFTIPAAEIVGDTGLVRALDINPAAVEYLNRKISKRRAKNVKVSLADATSTGLPANSIDVTFLFGVIHAFPKLDELLDEMHRVLKPAGKLSIQSHRSTKEFAETVTSSGLFRYRTEENGVKIFEKISK